jgi:hypothetical protein
MVTLRTKTFVPQAQSLFRPPPENSGSGWCWRPQRLITFPLGGRGCPCPPGIYRAFRILIHPQTWLASTPRTIDDAHLWRSGLRRILIQNRRRWKLMLVEFGVLVPPKSKPPLALPRKYHPAGRVQRSIAEHGGRRKLSFVDITLQHGRVLIEQALRWISESRPSAHPPFAGGSTRDHD